VAPRIRNGIDLSRLGGDPGGLDGLSVSVTSARVQTDWSGGMQSVTAYSAGPSVPGDTVHLIRCDESHDRCGDNTAPGAIGLAAAAVASSFLQRFVIEAALQGISLDAVTVDLEFSESESAADKVPIAPGCCITCSVDSNASIEELRPIALRAVNSAPVIRLLRDPPALAVSVLSPASSAAGSHR
jgi:hypothetical protein